MCHFELSLTANTRKQLRNQSGRISLKIASWTTETMFNLCMYIVDPCLYHSGSAVYFYALQTDYLYISGGLFSAILSADCIVMPVGGDQSL